MTNNKYTGETFGELTVLGDAGWKQSGTTRRRWVRCSCSCGSIVIKRAEDLVSGHTRSCGHLKPSRFRDREQHGRHGTPTYSSWTAMMARCYYSGPSKNKNYVGRGITVCKRWHRFSKFLADMGERPEGLTLDRKNNDKNYTLSNCRWADSKQQARNRAGIKLTEGKVLEIRRRYAAGDTQAAIAKDFGVHPTTISSVHTRRRWAEV